MALELVDNITSLSTGTSIYESETEFKVPGHVKRITKLTPHVVLQYETAGETIIVEYRIMRGMVNLVKLESDPIIPPANYKDFVQGRGSWGLDYAVDIPVVAGETLKLVRKNKDYYTCSPLAGLEIKYDSKGT